MRSAARWGMRYSAMKGGRTARGRGGRLGVARCCGGYGAPPGDGRPEVSVGALGDGPEGGGNRGGDAEGSDGKPPHEPHDRPSKHLHGNLPKSERIGLFKFPLHVVPLSFAFAVPSRSAIPV